MTETREQFRERMHEVGYDGAMIAWRDFQASEYAGAAEAGYAAALRDVLREFGRIVLHDDGRLADDIHAWAYNQMGIDLTDEMKAMFPDAYDNDKGAQS